MKTYWLEGREHRTPLKLIRAGYQVIDNPPYSDDLDIRTAGYSPVTFKEIAARRSIANSPIKYVSTARGNLICLIESYVFFYFSFP